jgi:hypothetical protein
MQRPWIIAGFKDSLVFVGVSIDRCSIELILQRDAARFELGKIRLINHLQSARLLKFKFLTQGWHPGLLDVAPAGLNA